VDKFHVFEMPILGYAGYLPFGIECVAVVGLIDGIWNSPGHEDHRKPESSG
jgi:hypothetical protein